MVLYGLMLGAPLHGVAQEVAASQASDLGSFKPRWQVGQAWVVEAHVPRLQLATEVDRSQALVSLRWRFAVEKIDNLLDEPCYLIEARPQDVEPEGLCLRLWVSTEALLLKGWELLFPCGGVVASTGEMFRGGDFPAYPASVPFMLVPIAFPVWEEIPLKDIAEFHYEARVGLAAVKDLQESRFYIAISQCVDKPDERYVKSVLNRSVDQLGNRDLLRIELQSSLGHWQQLWMAGQPWPVWASNGIVTSRLVSE